MAMDPLLVQAIRDGHPTLHLVTVADLGIYWTDGGFAFYDGHTYLARNATYGILDEIGEITDGVDDDGAPVGISVICPDLTALSDLASMDAQGSTVTIHLAAADRDTGALIGEPYRLHIGALDQPRLIQGKIRKLEYDIITADARALQPNEEQRQTDAFHKLIWGTGEKGNEFATDGTKWVYWREDEPRQAIGLLTGRGKSEKDDKRLEFTYEPNAPFAFPMGRCAIGGGSVRYRVGYGPTNRYQTVFATVGASGPVKSLVKVEFDDEVTTFDGSDRATNGSHAGEMWFKFLPGDQPSAALTSPTGTNAYGSAAPGWTTAHKLSGRPCFAWTGKENSKKSEYRGGIPKPVLTLEGLYGHDPRDVGSDIADPTTWPLPNDGATWGLNWCIGRWEGAAGGGLYGVPYQSVLVGGIGAPLDLIDVDAFTYCADVAEANGWEVSAVPYSDEDRVEVLEGLLQAAGALRIRKCGMISCITRGEVQDSVLTVTAADTAGRPEFSLGPSVLDRKNTAIPSFVSEEHRWEQTPVEAVTDAAWVTEDGGRQTTGFDYKYVPLADQAAQLAYLDLADGREKVAGEVPMKLYMMAVEPGQCITWDEPEYLLDGVKVRVLKRTYSPTKRAVKLAFRQETDAKVAAALSVAGAAPPPTDPSVPVDPTPSTPDGGDWSVVVRSLEASGAQQPGLKVTGAAVGENVANVGLEVGLTNTGPWTQVYFGPDTTAEAPIDALEAGESYYVAVTYWSLTGDPSARLVKGPYTAPGLVAESFVDQGALAVLDETDTPQITPNAVTSEVTASTSAQVNLGAVGRSTVQSVSVTTEGGRCKVFGNFYLWAQHNSSNFTCTIVVERFTGGVTTDVFSAPFDSPPISGDDYIIGFQPVQFTDIPPAGSHTYSLRTEFTNPDFGTLYAKNRFLSVDEMKR